MRMRILWIGCIVIALVMGAVGLSAPAAAQGEGTTGSSGNATWQVQSMTFESNYPKGFTLTIEATSTGGKIETATAFWRYSVKANRTRRVGQVNDTGTGATVIWEKGIADRVPQWVGVEYWWVLTDEADNSYETEHQFADYADDTRGWSRASSDDIEIFWEEGVPDELAPMIIDAMALQREFYAQNWPNPLGYRPRAIIYSSYETWAEWAPGAGTRASSGGVSTVVAGQTSDSWGATVQIYSPRWGLEETAYGTIVHEVAHLYQYANGGTRGDLWFVEGNATYFEMVGRERMLERVRDLAAVGELPSLQGGGPSGRGAFARDAYDIGFAFWVWLEEIFGPEAHRNVWTLIGQGRPWKDALQAVTNMGFVEMETTFRTWLGAVNPVAPTPLPDLPLIFPPTPTYEPTPVGTR